MSIVEIIDDSDYYDDSYDDGSFEISRIIQLDPVELVFDHDYDESSTEVEPEVGNKIETVRKRAGKEEKALNRFLGGAQGISLKTSFMDSIQIFVENVGKKKSKKVRAMCNYYYKETVDSISLPYKTKPRKCTRLELESEMKQTSEEEYNSFIAKLTESEVIWLVENHNPKGRMFSEANITSLMYENYVGKYVCVPAKSPTVWYFNNSVWVEVSPAKIWKELSTTFINFLYTFSSQNVKDIDGWKECCYDVARYLNSVASRERIQKDLLLQLVDETFRGKINASRSRIGMGNGVYDFKKWKLRPALPMDYISMSTGVDYTEKPDKVLYKELKNIIREIFPRKVIRKFFLQSCASFLEGRNSNKLVYIWWGKGNNAKSMIEKLLAKSLGDYTTVAPTSLVTGKRSPTENASPQMASLEGKLVVFLQEPNPDETIRIGIIKELSGGDIIKVRPLYQNPINYVPKFKVVVVCNSAIEISDIDQAFRNRLVVIPFESTFLTKENYKRREKKGKLGKYDFRMDISLARNIGKYSEVFIHMLVKEYKKIAGRELKIPKEIRKVTDKYIGENNFCLRYINEETIIEKEGVTSLKELHSEMKHWIVNHHSRKKIPNIEVFTEELINQGYEVDNGQVYGLAIRYD